MGVVVDRMPERFAEGLEMSFGGKGASWRLDVRFVEDGFSHISEARHFDHPHPAFNRLFLFERGGADLSMDGGRHSLVRGRIYLLPANRSFAVDYRKGSSLHFFHLSVKDDGDSELFAGASLSMLEDGATLFRKIVDGHRDASDGGALLWHSALGHAVSLFLLRQGVTPWDKVDAKGSLLAELGRHWRPGVAVKELAEVMGTTPRALAMRFKRSSGKALKPHLMERTLAKAREELCATGDSSKEIAKRLGFTDVCHFHRSFKKALGLTPAEYRRRNLEWKRI